jgi:hypothetical protein
MGRTACAEPQCLYKGALAFYFSLCHRVYKICVFKYPFGGEGAAWQPPHPFCVPSGIVSSCLAGRIRYVT